MGPLGADLLQHVLAGGDLTTWSARMTMEGRPFSRQVAAGVLLAALDLLTGLWEPCQLNAWKSRAAAAR